MSSACPCVSRGRCSTCSAPNSHGPGHQLTVAIKQRDNKVSDPLTCSALWPDHSPLTGLSPWDQQVTNGPLQSWSLLYLKTAGTRQSCVFGKRYLSHFQVQEKSRQERKINIIIIILKERFWKKDACTDPVQSIVITCQDVVFFIYIRHMLDQPTHS